MGPGSTARGPAAPPTPAPFPSARGFPGCIRPVGRLDGVPPQQEDAGRAATGPQQAGPRRGGTLFSAAWSFIICYVKHNLSGPGFLKHLEMRPGED